MISDRRRSVRARAILSATLRGKRTGRLECSLMGFSRYGGLLSGAGACEKSDVLWITLPGLSPQRAELSWCAGNAAGVEFTHPLHPAVTEHVAKYHGAYVEEPVEVVPAESISEKSRTGSRRMQILRGQVESSPGYKSSPILAVRPVC